VPLKGIESKDTHVFIVKYQDIPL